MDAINRTNQLVHAALTGDLNAIRQLVQQQGVDVNSFSMRYGCNALHHAALRGNYEVIQYLLENNADVNAKDNCDMAPLHYAFQLDGGSTRVTKLLLDHGADIGAIDKYGQTVLHGAINGHANLELVQFLLDNKADITASGQNGETTLHCSLRCGNDLVVQYLIDHDATDITATNEDGETVLHYACRSRRSLGVIQCLMDRKADIAAITKYGETALHSAVAHGPGLDVLRLDVVRFLIEHKVDVTATSESGETALHTAFRNAAHSNRPDLLELAQCLLQHGVDVNSVNSCGQTLLHLALRGGVTFEVIRCLLDHKANVNAIDGSGKMPLHCIVGSSGLPAPVMELLLSHDVDVLAKDHNLKTPLHHLANSDSTDAVTVLFDHLRSNGVPMESVLMCLDNSGNFPFLYVRSAAMAKLLLEQPLLPEAVCHDVLCAMHHIRQLLLGWEPGGDYQFCPFGHESIGDGQFAKLREYLLSYTDLPLTVPARGTATTCEHSAKKHRLEVAVRINPMLNEFQSNIAEKFLDTWDGWSTPVQQQDANKTAGVEQEELLPVELKRAIMAYLVLVDVMKIV